MLILTGQLWSYMTEQLLKTTHLSACESNSILGLLPENTAWDTVAQTVVRGLIDLIFSSLADCSFLMTPTINHWVGSVWCYFPFCQGMDHFCIRFAFLSGNKLSSLLLSVFASSMVTQATNFLLVSWLFLPLRSSALCHSSYRCCLCAVNILSYILWNISSNKSFISKCHRLYLSSASW